MVDLFLIIRTMKQLPIDVPIFFKVTKIYKASCVRFVFKPYGLIYSLHIKKYLPDCHSNRKKTFSAPFYLMTNFNAMNETLTA